MTVDPKISVIVCTYNREEFLPTCLEALANQSMPYQDYEVIIVDNNSTDSTDAIASRFSNKYGNFIATFEKKQGLAAARNKGISTARSDIAAFTDDDAIPSKTWVESLFSRFESLPRDTVAVGGEIEPIWQSPRPDWLEDSLLHPLSAGLGWSDTEKILSEDEWLCEVNSAYRIAPLQKHGGFPENLGRIGDNLLSGENAVNALLLNEQFNFFYDPAIKVKHLIPEERTTKQWFRRRMFWQGITGHYVNMYLSSHGLPPPHSFHLTLPANNTSWIEIFDERGEDFPNSLSAFYSLGFLLASQGIIVGR